MRKDRLQFAACHAPSPGASLRSGVGLRVLARLLLVGLMVLGLAGLAPAAEGEAAPRQVHIMCMAGMQREVWVGGQRVGFTPLEVALPIGRHWLSVSADSLAPVAQWIDVKEQGAQRQVVRLVPVPVTRDNYAEVSRRLLDTVAKGPPDPHHVIMAMFLCNNVEEARGLVARSRQGPLATDPSADIQRARLLGMAGELDAALECAERAVARLDRVALAWRVRAEALLALGRPGDALASANQAMILDPNCWRNLRVRARIHQALGNQTAQRTDEVRCEEMYRFLHDPTAAP